MRLKPRVAKFEVSSEYQAKEEELQSSRRNNLAHGGHAHVIVDTPLPNVCLVDSHHTASLGEVRYTGKGMSLLRDRPNTETYKPLVHLFRARDA